MSLATGEALRPSIPVGRSCLRSSWRAEAQGSATSGRGCYVAGSTGRLIVLLVQKPAAVKKVEVLDASAADDVGRSQ